MSVLIGKEAPVFKAPAVMPDGTIEENFTLKGCLNISPLMLKNYNFKTIFPLKRLKLRLVTRHAFV